MRFLRVWNWVTAQAWCDDHAAQIVEFAVSLPLLMVFVVGIYDFSGAYTLKQKLTNVARDAARAAAGDPASDLIDRGRRHVPVSVIDAFQIVDTYVNANLNANSLSDCGISNTPTSAPPVGKLIWVYSETTGSCTLTVTINRGYYFSSTSTAGASADCTGQATGVTTVLATCVNIQYAYPWRFGQVIGLLGARAFLPTAISATGVAMNEN